MRVMEEKLGGFCLFKAKNRIEQNPIDLDFFLNNTANNSLSHLFSRHPFSPFFFS